MSATDKELLELAAKAASVPLDDLEESWDGIGNYYRAWNPLADDGDALRLAVKLNMVIDTDFNGGACAGNADIDFSEPEYGYQEGKGKKEPYAATRRAIVRAAAEIGRRME